MNMLQTLLQSLLPEEYNVLEEKLMLKGREREVYELVKKSGSNDTKSLAVETLGVSGVHFDKIVSVLFHKSLEILAGGSSIQQRATYLYTKYLHDVKQHILKLYTNSKAKHLSDNEKKEFFEFCYRICSYEGTQNFSTKQLEFYSRQYLQCSPQEPDDALLLRCILFQSKIEFYRRSNKTVELTAALKVELNALLNEGESTKNMRAKFESYVAGMIFYAHYQHDSAAAKNLTNKALALQQTMPSVIKNPRTTLLLRQIGGLYMMESHFDLAYATFKRLYNEYPDNVHKNYHFLERFFTMCLVLDYYDEAAELLEKHYLPYFFAFHEQLTVPAATVTAKYDLLTNNYPRAIKAILLGEKYLQKSGNFHTDVQLRNLKTAYFYLSGKHETAEAQCSANIKFLSSKSHSDEQRFFSDFFRIIIACIDKKNNRTPFPKRLEDSFARFQLGSFAVHGKILKKIRENSEHLYKSSF